MRICSRRFFVERLVLLIVGSLLWLAAAATGYADQSVALLWDPSPSPDVVGYAVYYGTASGVYTTRLDAGTNTVATINGLTEGLTYFFVVTSYDEYGNESDPSNEVSFNVPGVAVAINALTTLVFTNLLAGLNLPAGPLTFLLVNPPAGAAIDANGVITWTPTDAQAPSTNSIEAVVTVSPLGLPSVSVTNYLTVIVNEVNLAPVLPQQANQTIIGRQPLVVMNTASDPDPNVTTFTYQLLSAPAGMAIDTNGVITWTPTANQVPSTNLVETIVTDYDPLAANVQQLNATNNFNLIVVTTNTSPMIRVYTVDELTTLIITNLTAGSNLPPGLPIYSLSNAPAGASILLASQGIMFEWTPTETQARSTNFITLLVTMFDGSPNLTQIPLEQFIVVVNEVNIAPVLPAQSNRTIIGLATLVVTNTATAPDVPSNSLTYRLVGPPAGALIDTNGVITWTPTPSQVPSTNLLETVATDYNPWAVKGQLLSATNAFTVFVTSAPFIGPVSVSNTTLTFSWSAIPDQKYRLQYKTELNQQNWNDLGAMIVATNATASYAEALGAYPQRFYRVILLSQ